MPQGIDQPVEMVVIPEGVPPSPAHDVVVNVTGLLGAETFCAASLATTVSLYGLLHARPVTVTEVAGGVPVTVA